MINSDGDVLGVVFGAADDTGFVLTAKQVKSDLDASEQRTARVSTGECVHS